MKAARRFPEGFEKWPRETYESPFGYDYGYFRGSAFRGEMHPVTPDEGLTYWIGRLWAVGDEDRETVFEVRHDEPWSVTEDMVAFVAEAAR